jgi:hypothetical protein
MGADFLSPLHLKPAKGCTAVKMAEICLSIPLTVLPLNFFNIQEIEVLCQLSGQLVERPYLPGCSLHVPPKK